MSGIVQAASCSPTHSFAKLNQESIRLLSGRGVEGDAHLGERGQLTQAEPLLERALSLREQVLGAEQAETARTLNELAQVYLDLGKYEQAERLLEPALARFERVLGPTHSMIAMTLNRLAAAYAYEGKYAQAEPLLTRALVIGEQTLGPEHHEVLEILHNLAILYETSSSNTSRRWGVQTGKGTCDSHHCFLH